MKDQFQKNQTQRGRGIGRRFFYFDTLPSTNDYAKIHGEEDGDVFLAREQTAGKGRRGKTWYSAPGEGIWMSVYKKPQWPSKDMACITLVAGLAVCEALREETGVATEIKWPNDVITGGKKLCGILTETVTQDGQPNHVVIGIGVNVNVKTFPEELAEKATSLYLETGLEHDVSKLTRAILHRFERCYDRFVTDRTGMMAEYETHCVNIGREVTAVGIGQTIYGVAVGISPEGELCVRMENGTVIPVCTGEVSVRGIAGYL